MSTEQSTDIIGQLCGVYTLTGIKKKSAIKIKHIDTVRITKGENIRDTCIERFEISKSNKIFGLINICNLTHNFIMSTKKLPMLYINVFCEKPLRSIHIMTLFLYFTIQTEVKTKEDLLENELNGIFTLEAEIFGENKILDSGIGKFPGNQRLLENLTNFTKNEDMINLFLELVNIEEEKIRKQFETDFGQYQIPKSIISLKNYKIDN